MVNKSELAIATSFSNKLSFLKDATTTLKRNHIYPKTDMAEMDKFSLQLSLDTIVLSYY